MAGRVRFVCLLHSHQPVGNFDHVIEEAYQKSYLPYVEVFEQFPDVPLTNHFSGCLLEWLDKHRPDYLDRLAAHDPSKKSLKGRPWEMIGGGFYEPIMTMLPRADRVGQIERMASFIEKRIGTRPRSLWLPERVWEPGLVSDLAEAGVKYLTLDDTHFKAAGLEDYDLTGSFVTEDQGKMVNVFPASERLRYMIPYAPAHEVVAYLKTLIPQKGERVVCYADDGEKFGVWPRTYQHVYTNGWLKSLLSGLAEAQKEGWLVCSTLEECFDTVEPIGKVYLPENSYREMTEWALPSRRLAAFDKAVHDIKKDDALNHDSRVQEVLSLVKGGNWRSFKTKYGEGGRMYAKMMEISRRIADVPKRSKLAEKARVHLHRGQCNCPYWHGVFGGMYLPHLRSAIYSELIKADRLADELGNVPPIQSLIEDFDFDGENEVKLANQHIALYLHPKRGGHLYELDLRDMDFNVADTFSRRFEAYHEKVALAIVGDAESTKAASIHDLILAKQPGLVEMLKYDSYLRESLVDHISTVALTPALMLSGNPPSDPEFRTGKYTLDSTPMKPRKRPGARGAAERGVGVSLQKTSAVNGANLRVKKVVSLETKGQFDVEYTLEWVDGADFKGFFGVEMNYTFLAGNAHDRFLFHDRNENAGKLATAEDFGAVNFIGMKDLWLNAMVLLKTSAPAQAVVSPVQTVSQSEGGFEAVYQSTSIVLQWPVELSASKRTFSVLLQQECGRVR